MTPLDHLLDRAPDVAHPFLRQAVGELDISGTRLVVEPGLQVLDCAGFYNDEETTLAVAVGKPFNDWFLVFVHEFCHFRQNQEDPAFFNRCGVGITALWAWLDGADLTPEALADALYHAKMLEFDCERRALSNLKAFGIDSIVDAQTYAQKANAYVSFYNYLGQHRVWYTGGREPYTLPDVWQRFPSELTWDPMLTPDHDALFAACVGPKTLLLDGI